MEDEDRKAAILDSVKRSADYMWANQWDAAKRCFWYPGPVNGGAFAGTTSAPAPDLNGLMVAAWGWLYKKTGDAKYKTQGADMIAGSILKTSVYGNYASGAYLHGQKQFNQTYLESYQYFAYAKA
jgi:hypothetical protein